MKCMTVQVERWVVIHYKQSGISGNLLLYKIDVIIVGLLL